MALFSLMAKLGLDLADYDSGLKKAGKMTQESTSKMASDVKSAGASIAQHLGKFFTVAALSAGIKFMSDAAGKIVDLADAYDLTTEQIQRMETAAIGAGVPLDAMVEATVKISEARKKATQGDEDAIEAFRKLGISLGDVSNKNTTNYDLLLRVGKASKDAAVSYDAQQAIVSILGAKSVKLTQAMRDLAELGPISFVTDEDLRKLDSATSKVEQLAMKIRNSALAFGSTVISFHEGLAAGEKAYVEALDRGLGKKVAKEEYSRAFLSVMSGMKLVRKDGKLVAETASQVQSAENPQVSGPESLLGGALTEDDFAWLEDAKMKKAQKAERASRLDRPSTGSLASIGGLYFGADYNTRLMTTAERQVRELEKISTNTKDTAERLAE